MCLARAGQRKQNNTTVGRLAWRASERGGMRSAGLSDPSLSTLGALGGRVFSNIKIAVGVLMVVMERKRESARSKECR